MGSSIVVDRETFATEVMQKSHQKPVLVDFFATWCGPCQMMKPRLEKLAQEYDFVLAKVDIDQNPELAQTYGVQGVPDVRIVINGEVQEGFVGVLPEPQLRQLMMQLNLHSELDTTLEAIYAEANRGNLETAQASLMKLLQHYPDNRGLLLEAANFYIEARDLEAAEGLLKSIQEHEKEYFVHARFLKALIFFKRIAAQSDVTSDLDQQFQKAAQTALNEDYATALDILLDIVRRDRRYRNDGARKAMLEVFNLLGDDHPLTKDYRKQLMLALY